MLMRGKGIGARADQEDMRRLFHHRPRQGDGMPRPLHIRNRSRHQRLTVHHCRIQLVRSIRRKDSPAPGIEVRIVLQNLDRRLDRIHRRTAFI